MKQRRPGILAHVMPEARAFELALEIVVFHQREHFNDDIDIAGAIAQLIMFSYYA